MKIIFLSLALLFPPSARALLVGRRDLFVKPVESCVLRDLRHGENLGSLCLPVWHFSTMATVSGTSVEDKTLHLGVFEGWTLSHGSPTFGVTSWVSLGALGDRIKKLLESAGSAPGNFKFLTVVGNFVSLGAWGGTNPLAGPLSKWQLVGGYGGKVSIPLPVKKSGQ